MITVEHVYKSYKIAKRNAGFGDVTGIQGYKIWREVWRLRMKKSCSS